ncbi:hypothetical protein [Desulfobotulus sp.]|jgi:hypothetical protein|uniref:hypothetical protein n=1 Tax=Desulfobotulus sp. TaxID=1940337 RepID=UPI002A358DB1|nr:hypothetical protein [Desulfobotulus sp.]MDY0162635.1 hypothetical protein [Desulfobotulus sp.]
MNSKDFTRNLVDYLYINEYRLDSYYTQVTDSIYTYDKQTEIKGSLGLTSIGVEAKQSLIARPATKHEKIIAVLDYLRNCNDFIDGTSDAIEYYASYAKKPGSKSISQKKYALVSFEAIQLFVPNQNKDFSFWLGSVAVNNCFNEEGWISFVILESHNEIDKEPESIVSQGSPYYALTHLLAAGFIESDKSIIENQRLREAEFHKKIRSIINSTVSDNMNYLDFSNFDPNVTGGLQSPSNKSLKKINALVSTPREVTVLFRVRNSALNWGSSSWQEHGIGEIYGYPIFVAAN